MKSNKFTEEMNLKTIDQLKVELVNAKKELFDLRFKNATNQLDNTSKITKARKNIARIQTVMTMKENA
ncbi:MAG: 50S ribosomal protein L29 [Eubacteriales bacterium]|nr:50S ribosomal protein L29 [Eubacteriales bacterium]